MTKRAILVVTVSGTNITSTLMPVLESVQISDKVGTHSDTAQLKVDDRNAQIVLPQKGAPVTIALGWEGGPVRTVFQGTVDEVKSSGGRSSGMWLNISAKGMDTTKKPKEGQQRHFDDKTVKDILTEAGKTAGITEVEVDPKLAGLKRKYFDMRDESFIHAGERLAREIGGNFRINGTKAVMSARGGQYAASYTVARGVNLHSWDIAPQLGRPQYNKARGRWYDKKAAEWKEHEDSVDLDVDARHDHRFAKFDENETKQQTASNKATSERDAGEGSVTIEGTAEPVPDGLCIVTGTRPGVDGAYRIETVSHTYNRGGGWVTKLELKQPQQGAGKDGR